VNALATTAGSDGASPAASAPVAASAGSFAADGGRGSCCFENFIRILLVQEPPRLESTSEPVLPWWRHPMWIERGGQAVPPPQILSDL